MNRKANLLLRLRAALWAAAVAAVPSGLFVWFQSQATYLSNPHFLLSTFLALPVTAAALSGSWIGWRLIDPAACHDARGALLLGLAGGLLTYVLMISIFLLIMVLPSMAVQTVQAGRSLDVLMGFLFTLLGGAWFVGVAIVYTGWFTLPVACIAGYLLSRRYRQPRPAGIWP